jgi:hypothetical protein
VAILPLSPTGRDRPERRGCVMAETCEPDVNGRCDPAANGGIGVIWDCDHCGATCETCRDHKPAGWLVMEFDEDDFPEETGVDVPVDVILCGRCEITVPHPAATDPSEGGGGRG